MKCMHFTEPISSRKPTVPSARFLQLKKEVYQRRKKYDVHNPNNSFVIRRLSPRDGQPVTVWFESHESRRGRMFLYLNPNTQRLFWHILSSETYSVSHDELHDLVRDLQLPKNKIERFNSRLQLQYLLASDLRVPTFRYHEKKFLNILLPEGDRMAGRQYLVWWKLSTSILIIATRGCFRIHYVLKLFRCKMGKFFKVM